MTVGCCCVARCRHRCDARMQSMTTWKHPPRHGRRSVNSSFFLFTLSSASASGRPCQPIFCTFYFDLFHRTIWSTHIHTVGWITARSLQWAPLCVCEAESWADKVSRRLPLFQLHSNRFLWTVCIRHSVVVRWNHFGCRCDVPKRRVRK